MHIRIRLEGKDIVHIEGMLRQFKTAVNQDLMPVNDIMHQNILGALHMVYCRPVKDLIHRKSMTEMHYFFTLCAFFIVYEICQEHINTAPGFFQFLQFADDGKQDFCVCPVITVDHLEIQPGSIPDSRINGLAVSAVLLMDRPDDRRVFLLIFICDLRRAVLERAVIDDQDLNILSCRKK